MTYRSVLVLLDNSATCAARTHVAMRLARERDCHLVGLAPTGLIDIPAATEKTPALALLRRHAHEVSQRPFTRRGSGLPCAG